MSSKCSTTGNTQILIFSIYWNKKFAQNKLQKKQYVNNLQDEIHFVTEIQEQHGKKNQIFHHHSHNHICNLSKRICK